MKTLTISPCTLPTIVCLAAIGLFLTACQRGQRLEDVPTLASVDALSTSIPLTENAPPPPFNQALVQFSQIDNGLTELPGWHYEVQLDFRGTYSTTTRPASASAQAEVWFNQAANARRIVFQTSGTLFERIGSGLTGRALGQPALAAPSATPNGGSNPLLGGVGGIAVGATATPAPAAPANTYEAVRLGRDAFLIQGVVSGIAGGSVAPGICISSISSSSSTGEGDSSGDAALATTAANLSAGDLVGGVNTANPAGRQATINNEAAFAYLLPAGELPNTPQIRLAEGGTSELVSHEVWVSPARGVVVRYYANLSLTNALILGQAEAVSGDLALRYDLLDAGEPYNITVPYGC